MEPEMTMSQEASASTVYPRDKVNDIQDLSTNPELLDGHYYVNGFITPCAPERRTMREHFDNLILKLAVG